MKATKIFYWILTAIVALMMAFSSYAYLTKPEMTAAFHHLGFPDYFRIELAIAKLMGAVVLLAPVPAKVKEWAYGGYTFVFVSAFIAHTVSGDPVANRVMPLVFLGILGGSYFLYRKQRQ
ncbi:DoxX family protein [Mucilaginibacter kameinonensis]|uniref:DoxX family protein n=1 Tax=Mucilaginibacter kameinonensis TaxID=452286 RepID=UPI000EF78026|nr:DoxX family protein [Mucilaginibacter kameinonensis]